MPQTLAEKIDDFLKYENPDVPLHMYKAVIEEWKDEVENMSGGIDGGTILLEVSTEFRLDNTIQYWSFDELLSTTMDVTLGVDDQTLTFNADGWYTVWYSFAVKASATTVKAQVESQISCSDPLNWIGQGSFAETQPHLDGSTSLADLATPFTSPPIHFNAGDTLKFRAAAQYTAGSVGDATLSSNTFVSVIRLA